MKKEQKSNMRNQEMETVKKRNINSFCLHFAKVIKVKLFYLFQEQEIKVDSNILNSYYLAFLEEFEELNISQNYIRVLLASSTCYMYVL